MLTNEQIKEGRSSYLGGSDMPALFGVSPFKTCFELALEKAGIKESEFKGSIYTEVGNYLEPLIQKAKGITNLDDEEYEKKIDGIRLVAHTDGEIGDEIAEIKVSSSDIKKIAKEYGPQVIFYMFIRDMDKARFFLYNRDEKLKKFLAGIREEYDLDYKGDFTYLEEEHVEQIKSRINTFLAENYKEVKKSEVKTKQIKMTDSAKEDLINKIKTFSKFVDELSIDLNFDVEDEEMYKSKENELNALMGFEVNIEDEEFDFVDNLFSIKRQLLENANVKDYVENEKKIEKETKNLKKTLTYGDGKYKTKQMKMNIATSIVKDTEAYIYALEEKLKELNEEEYKKIKDKEESFTKEQRRVSFK